MRVLDECLGVLARSPALCAFQNLEARESLGSLDPLACVLEVVVVTLSCGQLSKNELNNLRFECVSHPPRAFARLCCAFFVLPLFLFSLGPVVASFFFAFLFLLIICDVDGLLRRRNQFG